MQISNRYLMHGRRVSDEQIRITATKKSIPSSRSGFSQFLRSDRMAFALQGCLRTTTTSSLQNSRSSSSTTRYTGRSTIAVRRCTDRTTTVSTFRMAGRFPTMRNTGRPGRKAFFITPWRRG